MNSVTELMTSHNIVKLNGILEWKSPSKKRAPYIVSEQRMRVGMVRAILSVKPVGHTNYYAFRLPSSAPHIRMIFALPFEDGSLCCGDAIIKGKEPNCFRLVAGFKYLRTELSFQPSVSIVRVGSAVIRDMHADVGTVRPDRVTDSSFVGQRFPTESKIKVETRGCLIGKLDRERVPSVFRHNL
jgi:hypothetical protein